MPSPPEFDLEIVAESSAFVVHVTSAYAVGATAPSPLRLPFELGLLPQVRRSVADWIKEARVTRLRGSEELRRAREFGGLLFKALFTDEVLAAFRASRAALPSEARLQLRLRLPPALLPLPWELLYDASRDQFLALAPDLALVRCVDLPRPAAPLRIEGALRVVAVLASPAGELYPPINTDRELRRIEVALKAPIERGQLVLDVIRGPDTLGQLRARLRSPVHVLHILSHGDLDGPSGEGVLIFEDADGAEEPVSAELLRQQMEKQRGQTRLVLLNACLGALAVGNDPFSSVGAALLRGGVPAVVAMQFELAEDSAAELARVFYAELAAGAPLDVALTEARLHLRGRYPTQLDWAVPVFFLRADSDTLFEIASPAAPAVATTNQTAPITLDHVALRLLWQKGMTAFYTGDWSQAELLLGQVFAAAPGFEDVRERLAEARRQLQAQARYREIRALRAADRWQEALAQLDALDREQAGYADPDGLRRWAEGRRQREGLYEQALAAFGRSDWAAATTALVALLEASPTDADAQSLLARARANQRPLRRVSALWPLIGTGTLIVLLVGGWLSFNARGAPGSRTPTPVASASSALVGQAPGAGLTQTAIADRARNAAATADAALVVATSSDPTSNAALQNTAAAAQTAAAAAQATLAALQTAQAAGASAAPTPDALPTSAEPAAPAGRLAYVSRADGAPYAIQLVQLESATTTCLACPQARSDRLFGAGSNLVQPAWSPDGTQLALTVGDRTSAFEDIWVAKVDAQGQLGTPQRLTGDVKGSLSAASWSPDGTRIAFAAKRDGASQLALITVDGGTAVDLAFNGRPIEGLYPAWSPDGKHIAFVRERDGQADIFVVDLDTALQVTAERQLTQGAAINDGPAWSPDSRQIAFHSNRKGSLDIFVMSADGADQRVLTGGSEREYNPVWSPDGQFIAYFVEGAQGAGRGDIYLMRADGSEQHALTNSGDVVDSRMAWDRGL